MREPRYVEQMTNQFHAFLCPYANFCLESVKDNYMNTKENPEDVQDRRGGGSPPGVEFTPSVLPAVQSPTDGKNLQRGVSTRSAHNTYVNDSIPRWHVLRCTYGREKKACNYLRQKGIKVFYPTIITNAIVKGKRFSREESRLPNIFFAYETFDCLKEFVYDNIHKETVYLRFYYNHYHDGTKEPLVVPDAQMRSLMLICDSDAKDIIIKPNTLLKFLEGQRVIIKEGPFSGVEGIVARFMGQQRVGVVIEGLLTMVTAYVPSAFLERMEKTNI